MTTKKEEFEMFLEQQKNPAYVLGDITGTADGDMLKYTELKVAVAQEEAKIKNFNNAKNEAFKTLAIKQDEERIALGVEWQGYEDNNYTIPQ